MGPEQSLNSGGRHRRAGTLPVDGLPVDDVDQLPLFDDEDDARLAEERWLAAEYDDPGTLEPQED